MQADRGKMVVEDVRYFTLIRCGTGIVWTSNTRNMLIAFLFNFPLGSRLVSFQVFLLLYIALTICPLTG